MSSKRSTIVWIAALVALLLFIAAGVMGWLHYEREYRAEWSPARVKQSLDAGDRIVAMLIRFRREHSRYPRTLDELVPKYLPEIPRPPAGTRQWQYESDGDRCILKFSVQGGRPAYIYDSSYGEWKEER